MCKGESKDKVVAPAANKAAAPSSGEKAAPDVGHFEWVGSDEPHRSRRTAILAKYPQIKELYGPDIRLFYMLVVLITAQCGVAVYATTWTSGWAWFLLAYSVGGTLTHWISLGNHELAHGLAFKKPLPNELLGIVANFSQGLPSAIMFKRYHMEHHYFQGHDTVDMDIPSVWEGRVFNTWYKKIVWVLLQPAFYALRPVLLNPKPVQAKEVLNFIAVMAFNAAFAYAFGVRALLFNVASTLLGMGLHPVAGHFIAEHYTFSGDGQETFSYYGPLNMLAFNVGYHNEHHDFPRISGFKLPQVRAMAPEFYNNLHSYDSWPKVIYDYIARPDMGPFRRVKRAPTNKVTKAA
jgi:sphingolipid delta-4 desaturase